MPKKKIDRPAAVIFAREKELSAADQAPQPGESDPANPREIVNPYPDCCSKAACEQINAAAPSNLKLRPAVWGQ